MHTSRLLTILGWHPIYPVQVSHIIETYIYECLHVKSKHLLLYDLLVRLLLVILQVQGGFLASFQVLLQLSVESLSCLQVCGELLSLTLSSLQRCFQMRENETGFIVES